MSLYYTKNMNHYQIFFTDCPSLHNIHIDCICSTFCQIVLQIDKTETENGTLSRRITGCVAQSRMNVLQIDKTKDNRETL